MIIDALRQGTLLPKYVTFKKFHFQETSGYFNIQGVPKSLKVTKLCFLWNPLYVIAVLDSLINISLCFSKIYNT